jgi:hypothetical protein
LTSKNAHLMTQTITGKIKRGIAEKAVEGQLFSK